MEDSTGIVIYGSTGSIGKQALKVIDDLRGKKNFRLVGLVCNSDIETIEAQILKHKPEIAVVIDHDKAAELEKRLAGVRHTKISSGEEAALELCRSDSASLVLVATVGFSGLAPTLEAIRSGKDVALANKETLVTAGKLVMAEAVKHDVEILPIDSEHSAIWQALEPAISARNQKRRSIVSLIARGEADNPIESILLTASGGPFRGLKRGELGSKSVEEALNHPTWRMGGRITIDSATLMNKGFELIEAVRLFGVSADNVEVIVHPQSIMHSGVRLKDGNEITVQSLPNMEMPIQYAITWPERHQSALPRLSLPEKGKLLFELPDMETFGCLKLAKQAIKMDGTAPAVLNGADEAAVGLFLRGEIGFLDIERYVKDALHDHRLIKEPTLAQIREADAYARRHVSDQRASEALKARPRRIRS